MLFAIFAVAYSSVDHCPEGHTENVFVPNNCDCSSYFQCLEGKPVLKHCPPGLEWNAQSDVCDYPESANCHVTETCAPTVEPTVVPTGSTKPYPDKCPEEDDPEHDVLLPVPGDCTSFYKCYKGKPVKIPCPPGQEWADHLKRCDWPEVAQCKP